MKQIDRIIIKAKKISGDRGALCMALIIPNGDNWASVCHIWDGVEGHTPIIDRTAHATQDAAIEYIYDLAEKYPNQNDVSIIIDDI